jgi:hypothetical protein
MFNVRSPVSFFLTGFSIWDDNHISASEDLAGELQALVRIVDNTLFVVGCCGSGCSN